MSDNWSYRKDKPRTQAHYEKYGSQETPPRGTGWITEKTVSNIEKISAALTLVALGLNVYLLWKSKSG